MPWLVLCRGTKKVCVLANVSCLRKVLTPSLLNVTYADKNPGVTFDARLTGLLYAKAALGVWVPVYVFSAILSHAVL